MSLCLSVMPDQTISLEITRGSSLRDRARTHLRQSPYHAVRRVNVDERQGVLTLSGLLPNFFLKQMAQTAVAKIDGVKSIVNRIDVMDPKF